ncbi:leucine-rich melanocyte differentiation-associated protein-like [Styela clava]
MEAIYEDIDISEDVDEVAITGNRLCYSGNDCENFPQHLLRYTRLAVCIDLSHNKLKNINDLSKFVHLQELNLDNNEIDDETEFPEMNTLQTLSLNKNQLTNLEKLVAQLKQKCKNLTYLSLLGNAACRHPLLGYTDEDYAEVRRYIATYLPKLEIIDWQAVAEEERGDHPSALEATTFEEFDVKFTTENEQLSPPTPRAAAGKVRYTYIGKQSEGNRFIRNNNL